MRRTGDGAGVGAAANARSRNQVCRRRRRRAAGPRERGQSRAVGGGQLHHGRHRAPLGQRLSGLHRRSMRLAKEATRFDLVAARSRRGPAAQAAQAREHPAAGARRIPRSRPSSPRSSPASRATYGRGKYCPAGRDCLDINALSNILAKSRDPNELLEAWRGWHAISPPMKDEIRAFRRARQRGRARARLQGPRRAVAVELRHAGRRLRRRARSAVDAGQAALRRAPRPRARRRC